MVVRAYICILNKKGMKIELELPFSKDYKAGYLRINKEPRRVLTLVKNNGSITSISYARYLMSCYLKRYIDSSLEVDHKDDNKMNDDVSNLQLLSKANNIAKKPKASLLNFICPICKKEFKLAKNRAYKKDNPTCSRKCGGIKSHLH